MTFAVLLAFVVMLTFEGPAGRTVLRHDVSAVGQVNDSVDAALTGLNQQAVLLRPSLPGEAAYQAVATGFSVVTRQRAAHDALAQGSTFTLSVAHHPPRP